MIPNSVRFLRPLFVLAFVGGCANQGLGAVCSIANGDADCADGLVCTNHTQLNRNSDICCPPSTDPTLGTGACSQLQSAADAAAPSTGGGGTGGTSTTGTSTNGTGTSTSTTGGTTSTTGSTDTTGGSTTSGADAAPDGTDEPAAPDSSTTEAGN